MALKLQLKRNRTLFASKEEAMGKLAEQLSTAQAGEMIIATYEATPQPIEYKMIDFGLPSGLLWADKNIGASTEEEAGLYFQWGDTQGYTAEQIGTGAGQKAFTTADYKFSIDGSSKNFSKYNSTDGKTVLDPEDDGVKAYMGGDWRMPTYDDYKELYDNADVYFVPVEGEEIKAQGSPWLYENGAYIFEWEEQIDSDLPMKGLKFAKRGDASTYLFFPSVGVASDGDLDSVGLLTGAWSSSRRALNYAFAWSGSGNYANCGVDSNDRYSGCVLRGVMPQA